MIDVKKTAVAQFIAPIEEAELACRILEAISGMKRPPGLPPEQVLDGVTPDARNAVRRAALASMEYWRECIEAMQQVS